MSTDPERVKALLDTWQNLVNNNNNQPPPAPATDASETGPSVAALLSQLNSSQIPPSAPSLDPSPTSAPVLKHSSPSKDPLPTPPVTEDVRALTFQQALPLLAQLATEQNIVSALQKVSSLFLSLDVHLIPLPSSKRNKTRSSATSGRSSWRESPDRATLIGTGLSKHEAEMLLQAYERELNKFDKERVLPAWDGLVTSQQGALAQLRIPAIFPTAVKNDRERQQRVIQVLEGLVGT
ncbi:hypothetical protein FB45DRAFT_902903 [Roridomyces roridus]|uniref:Uncharacterized protein n=1 Tax=Roridomyces roridus TaxID=1738132 RepID=A0AAD7FUP0_9AGAR|nr:hypothetical protein FB45DRAFT_902903 [Roridomyces roridus]